MTHEGDFGECSLAEKKGAVSGQVKDGSRRIVFLPRQTKKRLPRRGKQPARISQKQGNEEISIFVPKKEKVKRWSDQKKERCPNLKTKTHRERGKATNLTSPESGERKDARFPGPRNKDPFPRSDN